MQKNSRSCNQNHSQQKIKNKKDLMDLDETCDAKIQYEFKQQQQMMIMQEMNRQQICDAQLFLESINDIFGIIDGHLEFMGQYKQKKGYNIFDEYNDKYLNNEMLNRVDSLVTVLKMFGIQCYGLKHKDRNENALILGQKKINAKLQELKGKVNPKRYNIYEAYAKVLIHMLKGNKAHFKIRIETETESKAEIHPGNMTNILSQVVGGQCKTYKKIDQYSKKDVAKKLNEEHKEQMKQNYPNGLNQNTKMPSINELYKVFGINNQNFEDELPDTLVDGKDTAKLPCNALITYCEINTTFRKKYLYDFPCQLLEDPFNTNDNKVLIRLAHPYESVKLRPFQRNIKFDHKTRPQDTRDIIKAERKHIKKYGKLADYYKTIVPENE